MPLCNAILDYWTCGPPNVDVNEGLNIVDPRSDIIGLVTAVSEMQ